MMHGQTQIRLNKVRILGEITKRIKGQGELDVSGEKRK
jgi:hypothetical protein